ncbi:response regulator transcription factor [Anaerosacchariphilus polymeriproducens]|uniref:response regulator transcription factor n=1 Tax=Anaerosacchariphilus polymeriproducens TaxID=1812858 RepID=UPI00187B2DE0|nr:response regulator transcription factor [Anaerosacchariphilus polymeriproducens]
MNFIVETAKILIVEDDTDINNLIAKIVEKAGHQVVQAFSGTEAQLRLEMDSFDLIILDLMLPGITGEELIELIREKAQMPILVLSAKNGLENRVNVLNLGADDYLMKPFENEEVAARVNASLRRYKKFSPDKNKKAEVLNHKNIEINNDAREVFVCSKRIALTGYEYDILYLLLKNPNKVFSRESLYEEIWNGGFYGEDNTVNVHISNLRKKIAEFDKEEEYIKTVWGIGFKLV